MTARQRAALRVLAIECADLPTGSQSRSRLAAGAASQAVLAAILADGLRETRDSTHVRPEDRREMLLAALETVRGRLDEAQVSAQATEWLQMGQQLGVTLRDLGDACGISHTAVRKRLIRGSGA